MTTENHSPIHRPYLLLLGLAVFGFLLVPVSVGGGMTGGHFEIGWPLPIAHAKIGFVSSESPRGLHLSPYWIFAPLVMALWAGIFFGIRRLASKYNISGWFFHAGIVVFFSVSFVIFVFNGFYFLSALISS